MRSDRLHDEQTLTVMAHGSGRDGAVGPDQA